MLEGQERELGRQARLLTVSTFLQALPGSDVHNFIRTADEDYLALDELM